MAAKSGPNNPGGRKPRDKVRQLQRRLWAAAKRAPGRRFHALYNHAWGSDVLEEAWKRVKANKGAAGVDGETIADVEQYGWGNYFKTGNAAKRFNQLDGYVWRRLRNLRIERKGRNLRPGEAKRWTREFFENLGLHRLRGTVQYPELAQC